MDKKAKLAYTSVGFIAGYASKAGFTRVLYYGSVLAAFVIGIMLGYTDIIKAVINGL